jgi:hypothetical protein
VQEEGEQLVVVVHEGLERREEGVDSEVAEVGLLRIEDHLEEEEEVEEVEEGLEVKETGVSVAEVVEAINNVYLCILLDTCLGNGCIRWNFY